MTKNFTEEQYQNIVDAWDSEMRYVTATRSVNDYLVSNNITFMGDEALAIANPLTREWAHEQYVEKEKKYYWKLKGFFLVKSASDGSLYFDELEDADSLSESEIREWGFNPDMFHQVEVQ